MAFNEIFRARKTYVCNQCGENIRPREFYLRNDNPWTRETLRVCHYCLKGEQRPITLEQVRLDEKAFGVKKEMENISTRRKSIFLSHCHQDKRFVERVADDLRKNGVNVWVDDAEIKLGDSLLEKISEGIQSVDYVAVFLSESSVNSEWVRKELEMAMNREIKGKMVVVLPVLVESCEIPLFLEGKLFADLRDQRRPGIITELILDRIQADT
ncbi:MAG: toll/interleukin-1 receptor domain-containing protein [Candidatus Thorarchaeota archaeon]|jgi:hypothetical protein